jgi:Flp pilus assembly protein TadB
MKALIFLIFIGVVVAVMIWTMRKSQAEADLVRRKSIKHRKKQEKEVLASKEDMAWPTIIRPVKGHHRSPADSEIEEPSMSTIEFAPSEHLTTQEGSSTKAGAYQ